MQIVDAQIHLWTNDLAPPHHFRAPYPIDDALRDMAAAGVDRAIVHPPNWDPDSNDYSTEAARQYPDKFATLGWFPLDETADASQVATWMDKTGMLGLRFIAALPPISQQLDSNGMDWLWEAANERELPMGLYVHPQQLPLIGKLAARFPRMRLMLDHLSVSPFVKLPDAALHFDALLALAEHPNIAVKASAVPSMATDEYPFKSTHGLVERVFNAYGAQRMFWGTDYTRMRPSWSECVRMFTEELPFLKGSDLEWVMGKGVLEWTGWT